MKSIIEEASSVIKAIEKGMQKAGNPREFSVKILEDSQKNFFGMTTRSAKISITFVDIPQRIVIERPQDQDKSPKKSRFQQTRELPRQAAQQARPVVEKVERVVAPQSAEITPLQNQEPIWKPEMVDLVKEWVKTVLGMINSPIRDFTVHSNHFHLKIQFNGTIYDNNERQKQFFAGLSGILIHMLKCRYKRPLKSFKIIFVGQ